MLSQYIISEVDEVYKTISDSETERMARPTTYINVTHVAQLANIRTSKLRIKTAYVNRNPVNLLVYPLFDVLYSLFMEIQDREMICANSTIGITESNGEMGCLHLDRLNIQVPEITCHECCIYEIYHLANQCGVSVSIDFLVVDLPEHVNSVSGCKVIDKTVVNPDMVGCDFTMLSGNDPLESLLDFVWDWGYISAHPRITCELVKANMDKPWDWYRLSDNPNLTMECVDYIMQIYLHGECGYFLRDVVKMFNWLKLCENPNFTYEFIKKYWHREMENSDEFLMNFHTYSIFNIDALFDFGCDYYFLLSDDYFDEIIITDVWDAIFMLAKLSDWQRISKIRTIPPDIIINNMDKPWDWVYILTNRKDLTPEQIAKIHNINPLSNTRNSNRTSVLNKIGNQVDSIQLAQTKTRGRKPKVGI